MFINFKGETHFFANYFANMKLFVYIKSLLYYFGSSQCKLYQNAKNDSVFENLIKFRIFMKNSYEDN